MNLDKLSLQALVSNFVEAAESVEAEEWMLEGYQLVAGENND